MSEQARGWVFVAAQAVLLAVLVFAAGGDDWSVPSWLRTVGSAGRLGGGALIVVAGVRLGTAASVHPAPTERAVLRTTGLYRFARHPIYTGVLVLAAAIAVTAGSWLHLAALMALVGVLAVKARFEEQLLAERFDGYAAYARATGRFVPWLGRGLGGSSDTSA